MDLQSMIQSRRASLDGGVLSYARNSPPSSESVPSWMLLSMCTLGFSGCTQTQRPPLCRGSRSWVTPFARTAKSRQMRM